MRFSFPTRSHPFHPFDAFTQVELIVSMTVLVLMMIMISQLFNSAAAITTMGNNHMDADSQARAVFDRMAIDFGQMLKRSDVDYYLKDHTNNSQVGNDQLAFYSQVPGYYSSGTNAGVPSPVSLVGYRVNPANNQLERYGCGLFWNGMSSITNGTNMPVIFSGSSLSWGTNTITTNWPSATGTMADPNYEPIGPEVFRMEYYYILRGQTLPDGTVKNSELSETPWDVRIQGIPGVTDHTSVNGMQDVAAICAVIAVINPKSRVLVSNQQLNNLGGLMADFSETTYPNPGDLEKQWESVLTSNVKGISQLAASSIRIYKRCFYLSQNSGGTP